MRNMLCIIECYPSVVLLGSTNLEHGEHVHDMHNMTRDCNVARVPLNVGVELGSRSWAQ